MARSSGRGDLFIQVGGNVAPLQTAMKAGQSVLNQFGSAAIDVQAEVNKAFAGMAANAPAEAKRIEQSYEKTFAAIRKNAQAVLSAPSGAGAVQVLNAAGARQAAEAAQAEAAALRQLADAAALADQKAGGANSALRLLAVATETGALEAQQYAAGLRGQAGALNLVEAELLGAVGAQRRLTQVSGQTRAGMQQLSYQLGDVAIGFAAGTPPTIIFAQQIGQVSQAISLMTTKTTGLIGFIGGPWGVALSAALVFLTPLVSKLFEESEAAKAATKASEDHKKAVDALAEAQGKAVLSAEAKLRADYVTLEVERQKAILTRQTTQALLEQARARLQSAASTAGTGATIGSESGGNITAAGRRVGQLEAALASNTKEIAKLEKATTQAGGLFVKSIIDGSSTPEGAIRRRFQKLEEAAQLELERTKDFAKYGRTLEKLDDARQAEIKALQAAKKSSSANRQSGRQVDFDQAAAIARAAGFHVKSGRRSTERQAQLYNDPSVNRPGNPVAPPGSSAHEGAKGRWALDIQFAPGLTAGKIRKTFADKGVSLTAVLKEKGHFHIEGSRSEAAAAENRAARAATTQVRNDNQFEERRDALNQQLLQAQSDQLGHAQFEADNAEKLVRAQQTRINAAIQNDVEEKKLSQAQADELKAINARVADQKAVNIALNNRLRLIQETSESASQVAQFRIEDVEYQASIARTSAAQRDLQLQVLDLIYEDKKQRLLAAKAAADLAGETRKAADIQAQINNLPAEKQRDQARARDGTQSPMDRYRDSLPQTLGEVQERLEEIQVMGLKRLEDDLASATVKALGLKGAIGDVVGELLKLAFQMAISAAGGNLNLGRLFGGGKAGGGSVSSSRFYLVGEEGPELFIPGGSGTIIPNHVLAAATMPRIPRNLSARAGNDNGGSSSRGRQAPVQNFYFPNSDADSFRRSERQVAQASRRRLAL